MVKRLTVGAVLVLLLAGCRPEVTFNSNGRQSKIDKVDVSVTLNAAGTAHIEQRYTFDSGDGGKVGLPTLADATGFVPGSSHFTVDGKAVTPLNGTFHPELKIRGSHATVGYDMTGVVTRYSDVAILNLDVLTSPENASRQDPDVQLSGTLTLPEGAPGTVEAHIHNGRDRTVAVAGNVVTFGSKVPIWISSHDLDVAFPAGRVPFVMQVPLPWLSTFRTTEALRDQADRSTDSTLASVQNGEELGRWILTAVAFGLPGIFWLFVLKGFLARLRNRRRAVGKVPDHLSDPPTGADPAVVAVLDGEGRPARRAVAGTILALAQRKAIEVQEIGDRLIVKVPLPTIGANGSEQIVLDALRNEASPEGVIEGPPIWRKSTRWWRSFRRDAISRANEQGLVTRWMPLVQISGALITTGIGISIFTFTNPIVYFVIVFGVQILGYLISFFSGWTLTDQGWRDRALWHGFARYIHDQGDLNKDVGPEGVVVWGPYLVYGSVLGETHDAARALTP
jgi:hypothetical protein